MAASVATIGYGGTLEFSTDGGTTYTAVGELKSCSLPEDTIDRVETTHRSSPNRTREYTPGLGEPNEVSFTINYNSTDYSALFTLQGARTVAKWRHTLAPEAGTTTGAQFGYDGNVLVGSAETPVDGVTELTCTIQRTGTYTFTAAS